MCYDKSLIIEYQWFDDQINIYLLFSNKNLIAEYQLLNTITLLFSHLVFELKMTELISLIYQNSFVKWNS